jgi:hypothetical protein
VSEFAIFALGAMLFLLFVLPRIGGPKPGTVLPNGQAANGLPPLAVAVSSVGLAAGSALVGIGLGRWKRPRPSPHDESPEA